MALSNTVQVPDMLFNKEGTWRSIVGQNVYTGTEFASIQDGTMIVTGNTGYVLDTVQTALLMSLPLTSWQNSVVVQATVNERGDKCYYTEGTSENIPFPDAGGGLYSFGVSTYRQAVSLYVPTIEDNVYLTLMGEPYLPLITFMNNDYLSWFQHSLSLSITNTGAGMNEDTFAQVFSHYENILMRVVNECAEKSVELRMSFEITLPETANKETWRSEWERLGSWGMANEYFSCDVSFNN